MIEFGEPTPRRQFLRFLGGTLGVGIGLMALPASALAKAAAPSTTARGSPDRPFNVTYSCSVDSYHCPCSGCSSGLPYLCTASGCSNICVCSTNGNCHYNMVQGGC